MKDKAKVVTVILTCVLMFYCALVSKMYEERDHSRELCHATGGSWDDNGLKPWWLTEGKCSR